MSEGNKKYDIDFNLCEKYRNCPKKQIVKKHLNIFHFLLYVIY